MKQSEFFIQVCIDKTQICEFSGASKLATKIGTHLTAWIQNRKVIVPAAPHCCCLINTA